MLANGAAMSTATLAVTHYCERSADQFWAEPLNALSAKLNDAVMRRLNAEVDVQHKPIKAVAAAFLKSVGLI